MVRRLHASVGRSVVGEHRQGGPPAEVGVSPRLIGRMAAVIQVVCGLLLPVQKGSEGVGHVDGSTEQPLLR